MPSLCKLKEHLPVMEDMLWLILHMLPVYFATPREQYKL